MAGDRERVGPLFRYMYGLTSPPVLEAVPVDVEIGALGVGGDPIIHHHYEVLAWLRARLSWIRSFSKFAQRWAYLANTPCVTPHSGGIDLSLARACRRFVYSPTYWPCKLAAPSACNAGSVMELLASSLLLANERIMKELLPARGT